MAKYLTRSVVDAEQFNPDAAWPIGVKRWRDNQPRPMDNSIAYIDTDQGRISVFAGDYIARGADGKTFVFKRDVFEANYELLVGGSA